MKTFWLVTVYNKELPCEADVGLAVSLGADDAEALGQEMTDQLAAAGHGRCAYRVRELRVDRAYRASALLLTTRLDRVEDLYHRIEAVIYSRVGATIDSSPAEKAYCVKCGVHVDPLWLTDEAPECPHCHFDTVVLT